MSRIGILGGSFNPVHNGHIAIGMAAQKELNLEEVWYLPTVSPYYKEAGEMASYEHRLRMLEHALESIPTHKPSDVDKENKRGYTIETLKHLKKKYPKHTFYFIMGGDSLAYFPSWRNPEDIVKLATIVVAKRGKTKDLKPVIQTIEDKWNGTVHLLSQRKLKISSTKIREQFQNGTSPYGLCPDHVIQYIKVCGLYHSKWEPIPSTPSEIEACLRATLTPKRFRHSIGVALMCQYLAQVYGLNEKKAYIAGILHDNAKFYTPEEQLELADLFRIPLTNYERENLGLIHGKLGAHFAQTRFGVTDPEILDAITFHTTGKPEMSELAQILYIADYIEVNRNMDSSPYPLNQIRKTAAENMNHAIYMILSDIVPYLQKTGKKIDPLTQLTYMYYKENI